MKSKNNNCNKKNSKGFSLIEAMIAVVVFSFGLLGVAGVMTVAVKGNHNGYMRSQANFLLASMGDMLRGNAVGVIQGGYNGTYQNYSDISTLCRTSDCGMADIQSRDTKLWANMINQILPNSKGEINCTAHNGLPAEPYSGFCTITITWTESDEIDSESIQTTSIIVKPII